MKHKVLGAVVPVLFLSACATVTVDRVRTDAVRKVAIVGFSVQQEVPDTAAIFAAGPSESWMMPMGGSGLGTPSPLADTIYHSLEKGLAKERKWKVVERAVVAANPAYQAFYEQKMKGLQMRPSIRAHTKLLSANGIVDAQPVEVADVTKHKELLKKLGVDAIAVAHVDIKLEKGGGLKKLVGAGDYYPQATSRFAVFDGKSEEPMWRDLSAEGERVSEGVEHIFGISTKANALDNKMAAAAENSFSKLMARFRDGNG